MCTDRLLIKMVNEEDHILRDEWVEGEEWGGYIWVGRRLGCLTEGYVQTDMKMKKNMRTPCEYKLLSRTTIRIRCVELRKTQFHPF